MSASPVFTSRFRPGRGLSVSSSFTSSSRIRSAETIPIRGAIWVIAVTTSSSGSNPSWEVNRAARIIRSGSSENDSSAAAGVRITWVCRSPRPPNGSSSAPSTVFSAIAFTVKSRRTRSPPRWSPNCTSGLRVWST